MWHFERVLFVVAVVAAWLVASVVTAEELPTRKMLPLELAREAAAAAIAACADNGYKVSAAVVGPAGLVKALMRADGAGPHTLDSSGRKAYTALSLRHSTRELATLVTKHPEAAGLRDMNENILVLGGGLPIRAGEAVIGGIGVGGAPGGDKDEACARAGIAAISERLR